MTTVSQGFANDSTSGLSFTNVIGSETDVGTVFPFVEPGALPTEYASTVGNYQTFGFNGFSADALAPGSSISLSLSYDVTSTVAGQGISSLQQSFTSDGVSQPANLTIQELVYTSNGTLVGSTNTNLTSASDPLNGVYNVGDLLLNGSYSSLHVVVNIIASVPSTAPGSAYVGFSSFEEGFQTSAVNAAPPPGSLSGNVFLDSNADGVKESGETNLAGITVQLLDSNGNVIVGSTTTTDASGNYSFSALAAGNYAVEFIAPNGDKFSPVGTGSNPALNSSVNSSGFTGEVSVVAGSNTPNLNAGLYVPATITTHVYTDANDDGSQDNGEGNLSGVTVNLLTSAGVFTGVTAITDANGNVSFTGLTPGIYQVSVNTPTGDTVTQHTNVTTPITVTSGQTANAIEGLFNPGALSGHIFTDLNADGIQETGDTNLAGVTVTLLNSAGASTGTTAITDANGFYQFSNLVAGTYSVAFTAPTGDKFSATTAGTSSVDSIVNTTTGKTSPVAVVAGATTTNQNAAVYLPPTLTAHVYSDANDNSTQDTGDTNLAGVTVNLLTGAGVATGVTAITDANGNVSFAGLTPGSYEVSVNTPTGDTVTQHTNVATPITLTSGGTATATEGLFNPGALSGHIFTDLNADGIQETGDTNLAGVTVTLLNSAGTSTGTTAITDANGFYQFSNLVAGTYSVAFTAPTGDKFSATTAGTSSVDSIVNTTTGKTSPVAVVAGATTTNQNAAVYLPATLTAHVYSDANDNSTQDTGDTNLAGVTVNLLTGAGVATGVTAITDANGNVSFAGLTPGSYEVSVNTPTGDTVTQHTNVATPITLTSGGTATATEGLFNPGALSGHIFTDLNADGIQETGDTNLAGVTVTLLNSAGTSTGTTAVTDANGFYQFSNLVAGTYSVAFTAPTGDKFSATTAGTSSVDSIVNTTTGKTSPVAVVAGATTTNQNAAVYLPATLTAHVYSDANDNSTQDTGDTNLAGVTVNLLTGAGVATGVTAITDANGNVSFAGLTPGSYEVSVNTPTGDTVTQHTNVATPITLTSGGTATATEGLFVPASLSGHVFLDQNDNGIQETGDTNLAGVTVLLYTGGGVNTGLTAVTDANGSYSFTSLVAGTYIVAVQAPTGDKFDTVVGTNSNAAVDSIVNSVGMVAATVTAGNSTPNQNAGVFAPATITTHVYSDVNDDSSQESGEGNLAGITVNLLTSAGVATGTTAITDANGNVSFTGLTPGSYEVSVNTPTGDTVTQHTNVATPITVTSGQTANAIEGLFNPGALSGHIFTDLNADGIQETGDTNLAGVTVTLLNSAGTSTGTTAVTDANGFYQFSNLVAGTYSVAFTAPTGDKFSATTAGTSSVDSIVNTTTGKTSPVAVVAGATTTNQNAAVYLPATLTTHVYADTNKDSSQDNGEGNLAGVTVNLLTGAGVATGVTAITDANGNVSFAGLTPGSYEVSVVTPAGDTVTQATNVATPIMLTSGGTATAIEGLYASGSLCGRVFVDYNANGVYGTAGTSALGPNLIVNGSFENPGVCSFGIFCNGQVQGWTSNNNELEIDNSSVVGQTNYDGVNSAELNGNTFDTISQNVSGLIVGQTYQLGWAYGGRAGSGNEEMDVLVNGTKVAMNTSNGVSNLGWTSNSVTFVATATTETLSFAAINVGGNCSVGNELDAVTLNQVTGSGILQDYGVPNQTVTLLTAAGVSTGLTTTTDANGNYCFMNIAAGTYEVQFTALPGAKFDSVVGTNANAALDSVVNVNGLSPVETVTVGNMTSNVNAGEYLPATFTTHVYYDANSNAVQDSGDSNLAGVTVSLLTGAGVATGATAVTDANGNVSFTGLAPGSYEVAVTTPTNDRVTQTKNVTTVNTLYSGQTATAVEGVTATVGALSGRIFGDYNADGVYNTISGTDFGLSGQTVQLLNSSGVAISGVTAITDANGNYSFSNLAAGTYEVQVVPVAGAKFSQVGTNASAALDSVVNASGVSPLETVVAGQTTQNVNAGEYAPATFNTHVYLDNNKNSTQDTGDTNLGGVTVKLLTGTGAATGLTAVTDANGNVSFTGLAPGSYEVAVVTPTGDTVTQSTNISTPVTLAVGQTASAIEGLAVPKPSLSIVKTPSVTTTTPGIANPPLTYTFAVTNTGTTTLSGVSVTDVTGGNAATAVTYTDPNALAAGATWTYTTSAVNVAETQYSTPTEVSGHGFNLGDVLTYGIIAFHPGTFTLASCDPVVGNVGVGSYGALNVTGGGIAGDLETTGALPGYNCTTSWNWSTWSNVTTITGCNTCSSTSNCDTSYGSVGWSANWGNESGTSNNCYSNFGCNGSTGSAVWDDFWSQCTTASVCPLVVNVSEDAWQGNAQFTICVDGKQVGGTYTATANHSQGQSQAFNLGNFSGGNHTVSVNFLNDAYGGSASTDRNLYVNSISDNGNITAGCEQASNGTINYCSTPGAVTSTGDLTVNVSEDAWQGNAQFTVCVDGQQVGGTYTSTTLHSSGGSQAFDLGQFALGNHTVTVNFLNDAYGGSASTDRNLYVNNINFNGANTAGCAQNSSGAASYCVTTASVGGDDSDDTWGNFFNSSCSTYNGSYSNGAYGQIANSATLTADIAALASLSTSLFSESGTSVALCSGTNLAATAGKLDASGNEVFNVTAWSNSFTVTGDGSHSVVLDVASGVNINLGQLSLSGGISANQVMINYTGTNTITDTNCNTVTNATILAPNAAFNLQSGTVNGHVLGGASGQAFTIGSGASVEAPPLTAYNLTDTATATGTSGGTTVTATASASVVVDPSASGVSQNCNAPSTSDNLCNDYGQAQKLEFNFNPCTTVNTNAGSCGITAGSCSTSSSNPCFITITDSASDSPSGCNVFYEGSVTAGEKIIADASTLWNGTSTGAGCFSTTADAMLYCHVYTSQSAFQAGQSACQEVAYDTSGAHGVSLGDQVGCLTVAGYVSNTGHGYLC